MLKTAYTRNGVQAVHKFQKDINCKLLYLQFNRHHHLLQTDYEPHYMLQWQPQCRKAMK